MYDHFNPNMGIATDQGKTGLSLKAQNQYMGKETTEKHQMWTPEEQKAAAQKQQFNNNLDDLDDLEEVQME